MGAVRAQGGPVNGPELVVRGTVRPQGSESRQESRDFLPGQQAVTSLISPPPCPDLSPAALRSSPEALGLPDLLPPVPKAALSEPWLSRHFWEWAPPQALGLPYREGSSRALNPQGGKLEVCLTVENGGGWEGD